MANVKKQKSGIRAWIERRIFKLGPEPSIKRFSIVEAFPPSDPLAIDLLRLLAAYNDFSSVDEWLLDDLSRDNKRLSFISAIHFTLSKMDLQLRLLGSILHEAIQTIEEFAAAPSSKPLLDALDEGGRRTLQKLLAIPKGADPFSRTVLAVARHKLSYHYDKTAFQNGLNELVGARESDQQTVLLLLQAEAPSRSFYFSLADDLRRKALQKHSKDGKSHPELEVIFQTHDLFRNLLRQLLIIYSKHRALDFGLELSGTPSQNN